MQSLHENTGCEGIRLQAHATSKTILQFFSHINCLFVEGILRQKNTKQVEHKCFYIIAYWSSESFTPHKSAQDYKALKGKTVMQCARL